MGRGIDIVLSGFSTKRNLVGKKGEVCMFRFTSVGDNLLLGHLCQDDDSPPHRHNSCISFSLLLIFLHRHHPKQSRGCKREKRLAASSLEAKLACFWGIFAVLGNATDFCKIWGFRNILTSGVEQQVPEWLKCNFFQKATQSRKMNRRSWGKCVCIYLLSFLWFVGWLGGLVRINQVSSSRGGRQFI